MLKKLVCEYWTYKILITVAINMMWLPYMNVSASCDIPETSTEEIYDNQTIIFNGSNYVVYEGSQSAKNDNLVSNFQEIFLGILFEELLRPYISRFFKSHSKTGSPCRNASTAPRQKSNLKKQENQQARSRRTRKERNRKRKRRKQHDRRKNK